MRSPVIDAFELNGRTTLRFEDGSFLRLRPDMAAPEEPGVQERIHAELASRHRSHAEPLPGRRGIGAWVPAGFFEGINALLPAATLERLSGEPAESCGLVLHFAPTPAERSRLDQLPASGTAVLRCYREGDILYIDPLATGTEDPGGSQVLRRRLAASPASAELERWLQTPSAEAASLHGISAAAEQIFLARLATTIAAWQHGSPACAALRRTLWRLDAATLLATEHPVLAFPEPAPLPEAARAK